MSDIQRDADLIRRGREIERETALVRCPRCGGDGGDRYLCWLCVGEGEVTQATARVAQRLKEKK